MTPPVSYQRGDVVVVHFPFTDMSQTKKRPALILSNSLVNSKGDYLMVQITSQHSEYSLSLPIGPGHYVGTPLPLTSYVRVHKLFLLNKTLISHRFTALTPTFCQVVVEDLVRLIS